MTNTYSTQITTHLFADDGSIPNNPTLPLILYSGAIDFGGKDAADVCEELFAANGWGKSWRNGIFSYHHYHSNAHEVLAIAQGRVEVYLGGERGSIITVKAGDVILIPAGVGHKNLGASTDLLVIGAYPPGPYCDLCYGHPEERPQVLRNIEAVPLPSTDPVYGNVGPLFEYWQS
ncbi:MAG: cupin domain-containing protein [Chloroflexota bacterium]